MKNMYEKQDLPLDSQNTNFLDLTGQCLSKMLLKFIVFNGLPFEDEWF